MRIFFSLFLYSPMESLHLPCVSSFFFSVFKFRFLCGHQKSELFALVVSKNIAEMADSFWWKSMTMWYESEMISKPFEMKSDETSPKKRRHCAYCGCVVSSYFIARQWIVNSKTENGRTERERKKHQNALNIFGTFLTQQSRQWIGNKQ